MLLFSSALHLCTFPPPKFHCSLSTNPFSHYALLNYSLLKLHQSRFIRTVFLFLPISQPIINTNVPLHCVNHVHRCLLFNTIFLFRFNLLYTFWVEINTSDLLALTSSPFHVQLQVKTAVMAVKEWDSVVLFLLMNKNWHLPLFFLITKSILL